MATETKNIIKCDCEEDPGVPCQEWFTYRLDPETYLKIKIDEGTSFRDQSKPLSEAPGTTCRRCNKDLCLRHANIFQILNKINRRTAEVTIGPLCDVCVEGLTQLIEDEYLLQILDIYMKRHCTKDEKLLESDDDIVMILRQIEMK